MSGLLPVRPDGTKLTTAPFREQAECVLDSLAAILEASGSGVPSLISCRVYIVDIANWGEFNALSRRGSPLAIVRVALSDPTASP